MQATSLRHIKNRIKVVEGIKKLTHAIEMVSMSKSKATEGVLVSYRTYFKALESLLAKLFSCGTAINNPFVSPKPEGGRTALCVVTSDTGLCGSYNHNIIRKAEELIRKVGRDKVDLITVGKRGFNYFTRKGIVASDVFMELHGRYKKDVSEKILAALKAKFLTGGVGQVYIAYTNHLSATRRIPTLEKFLSLEPIKTEPAEYIIEPGINAIMEKVIEEYLSGRMKMILLNAFACEHSARLIAMSEATKNAKELMENLILSRNKLRQTIITSQIMEIVSSAEAMKG